MNRKSSLDNKNYNTRTYQSQCAVIKKGGLNLGKKDRVELAHKVEELEKRVQKLEEEQRKSGKLSTREKVLNITALSNLTKSIIDWIKFFK